MRLSGALPGARIRPVGNRTTQSRLNRIVFDISNDAALLIHIPDTTIKIISGPERTGSFENPIGISRTSIFDSRYNSRDVGHRPNQKMNMIRHDHPTAQFVVSGCITCPQYLDHSLSNLRLTQPFRTGSSGIQKPVKGHKFCAVTCVDIGELNRRQRSSQTPGQKDRNAVSVPVG